MKRIRILLNISVFIILIGLNFIFIKMYLYQRNKDEARILALKEIFESRLPKFSPIPKNTDNLKKDKRIAYLRQFFRKYDSVLYDKSEHIVAMADKYNIDYRLVPAIAMQESNLCKKIPLNSNNCWGWGIYGDNIIRFDSYEQAIEVVSKGLKENYIDQGLVEVEDIMRKYTPPSQGTWARAVNYFLQVIE